MQWFRSSFVIAALAVAGCHLPKAGIVPLPLNNEAIAISQTRWPESTWASMTRGRDLFIANCRGCHEYPDTNFYPEEKWPKIMEEMGRKSDLKKADSELVLRFVLSTRTQTPAPTAAK